MKIVRTSIEEQIDRVDRQRSLYFGIGAVAGIAPSGSYSLLQGILNLARRGSPVS